jgi:hypothetical protein
MSAWTGQRGKDDQHTARQDIKDRIIGTGNHDRTATARQPGHRAAKKRVTRQLGQLVQTTGTRPGKTTVVGQPRQDSRERITGTEQPGQASLDILAWTGQVRLGRSTYLDVTDGPGRPEQLNVYTKFS